MNQLQQSGLKKEMSMTSLQRRPRMDQRLESLRFGWSLQSLVRTLREYPNMAYFGSYFGSSTLLKPEIRKITGICRLPSWWLALLQLGGPLGCSVAWDPTLSGQGEPVTSGTSGNPYRTIRMDPLFVTHQLHAPTWVNPLSDLRFIQPRRWCQPFSQEHEGNVEEDLNHW